MAAGSKCGRGTGLAGSDCDVAVALFSRYRNREFGSRLMTRLVLLFALVGILPGSVIYVVSVNFVSHSIESWFDVKVESAMESGKNLGLSAMEFLLADLQAKARDMSSDLSSPSIPLSAYSYTACAKKHWYRTPSSSTAVAAWSPAPARIPA
jgi:hypothetical protein